MIFKKKIPKKKEDVNGITGLIKTAVPIYKNSMATNVYWLDLLMLVNSIIKIEGFWWQKHNIHWNKLPYDIRVQ